MDIGGAFNRGNIMERAYTTGISYGPVVIAEHARVVVFLNVRINERLRRLCGWVVSTRRGQPYSHLYASAH